MANKNKLKIAVASLLVLFFPVLALAGSINSEELLRLVNSQRLSKNLNELKPNHKLLEAAYKKARDILDKGYFAHTNPQGKPFYQWIEEESYDYLYAGENLAIDFSENEPALTAWLASPRHRENILNKNYADTGLAVVTGNWNNRQTSVAVQLFGSHQNAALTDESAVEKNDLTAVAGDLIILPGLSGEKYLDVLAQTGSRLAFVQTRRTATNPFASANMLSFNLMLAALASLLILHAYRDRIKSFYSKSPSQSL